jgi:hypothetical protein
VAEWLHAASKKESKRKEHVMPQPLSVCAGSNMVGGVEHEKYHDAKACIAAYAA